MCATNGVPCQTRMLCASMIIFVRVSADREFHCIYIYIYIYRHTLVLMELTVHVSGSACVVLYYISICAVTLYWNMLTTNIYRTFFLLFFLPVWIYQCWHHLRTTVRATDHGTYVRPSLDRWLNLNAERYMDTIKLMFQGWLSSFGMRAHGFQHWFVLRMHHSVQSNLNI